MIPEKSAPQNRETAPMGEEKRISPSADNPSTFCRNCGTIKKNHSSTMTSGIERNSVTYPFANHSSGLMPERRSNASTVPHKIPNTSASSVILKVMMAPVHSVGSELTTLLQLK